MIEQEIVEKIGNHVLSQLGISDTSEIEDIDTNPGGFWINLKNGEIYFLMVGKCEDDAGSNVDK
jgi:hypothetical protein